LPLIFERVLIENTSKGLEVFLLFCNFVIAANVVTFLISPIVSNLLFFFSIHWLGVSFFLPLLYLKSLNLFLVFSKYPLIIGTDGFCALVPVLSILNVAPKLVSVILAPRSNACFLVIGLILALMNLFCLYAFTLVLYPGSCFFSFFFSLLDGDAIVSSSHIYVHHGVLIVDVDVDVDVDVVVVVDVDDVDVDVDVVDVDDDEFEKLLKEYEEEKLIKK